MTNTTAKDAAHCRNCSGTGRIKDTVTAAITHRSRTVQRGCRYCKGTGKLVPIVLQEDEQEIGEIPAWMLGLDEDKVEADDELLDRLGSAIPGQPTSDLDVALLQARSAVDALIPDLVDTDTAITVIQAGVL